MLNDTCNEDKILIFVTEYLQKLGEATILYAMGHLILVRYPHAKIINKIFS